MDKKQQLLLNIVRFQLFGGEKPQADGDLCAALLREARHQTVFTAVFPFLSELMRTVQPREYEEWLDKFLRKVMRNTNNFLEHGELHALMTAEGIPYCAVKGLASARYYPEASLRDMGDVDYIVPPQDFERAKQAVIGAGFAVDHGENEWIHLSLTRPPKSVWEQHRSINGVPAGETGRRIQAELDATVATAEEIKQDGVVCRIPDAFHHGLIMLLHVASHMTRQGIGLRHLCDWAVFAARLDSEAFAALFEKKLKSFGLWRFAQILTLVSERYLGAPHRAWAENGEITEAHLEEVITDILSGGNFGLKDANRYRESKYIADRKKRTVDDKSVAAQALGTLNQKVYSRYDIIRRRKILLPAGWIAEGGRYIGMLAGGKRRRTGTAAMLKEAAKRKSIYSRMALFEEE